MDGLTLAMLLVWNVLSESCLFRYLVDAFGNCKHIKQPNWPTFI
jgi:heme/copper-type cytochrome/quinol oxidase subunit 3